VRLGFDLVTQCIVEEIVIHGEMTVVVYVTMVGYY